MGFTSNAEKLRIEIDLITTSVHQGIISMSNETTDYMVLVEQAKMGIQTLMDATGMSAASAAAQIKSVNTSIIATRDMAAELGMSMAGLPQPMNTTLLNSALRDGENLHKGVLATMSAEVQADNKLLDIQFKRNLADEEAVNKLVEKVTQKRAELQVDESDLAFEKLKSLELEKQLQLQTGMNAQQRAITAGRIPLADVDMTKALLTNVGDSIGKMGGIPQTIGGMSTAIRNLQALNPQLTFSQIGNAMVKAGGNAELVAKGVKQIEPATRMAAKGFSILRSAMGFLVAMGMSALMQGIITVFKKIIDSASQAEQAFIKLAIAEKSISQLGVDITPKELTDIIDKVSQAYLSVSKIDAQKMVSSLAVLTKDLKLSANEYEKLAMAIPLIAQQAGVSIDSATNQVITGLTKSGRGWADLGITVDAEIIKQKAVSAGIVKTREEYEALTAEQKQQVEVLALLQILEDNTINNKSKQIEYNNSLAGSQVALNASWEDFAASLGKFAAPTIIQFLQSLTKWLENTNTWLENNKTTVGELSAQLAGLSAVYRLFFSNMKTLGIGSKPMDYSNAYMKAYLQAKQYQDDMKAGVDTPTSPTVTAPEVNQNLLDAEKKFNQEILDAQLKLGQDLEEAAIDYERKRYDIAVEYGRKRADLEKDYANKVGDINRSYADKISDINQRQQEEKQKQRNDELQREREFQNQMLVLKENFLMALDDALHNRDARQILKLIKNYELDKAQAERKHELDKKSASEDSALRQKSFAEDRKKAEADRQAKLKEAQQDYADKLAKLKADEAAEYEAARLANERKIEDLNREMQDRYEIIAANLVREYDLTEANLQSIVALYLKYYGNATQILAAMRAQLAGTMAMVGSVGAMMGQQYSAPIGPLMGGGNLPSTSLLKKPGNAGGGGGFKKAEGGTMFANKPTTVTFGEAGMEMASFMPMGRVGKDVNSIFSNVSGGDGGSGKVSIELLLSPDLESRIVSNTLGKTAEVFTKQMRTKR